MSQSIIPTPSQREQQERLGFVAFAALQLIDILGKMYPEEWDPAPQSEILNDCAIQQQVLCLTASSDESWLESALPRAYPPIILGKSMVIDGSDVNHRAKFMLSLCKGTEEYSRFGDELNEISFCSLMRACKGFHEYAIFTDAHGEAREIWWKHDDDAKRLNFQPVKLPAGDLGHAIYKLVQRMNQRLDAYNEKHASDFKLYYQLIDVALRQLKAAGAVEYSKADGGGAYLNLHLTDSAAREQKSEPFTQFRRSLIATISSHGLSFPDAKGSGKSWLPEFFKKFTTEVTVLTTAHAAVPTIVAALTTVAAAAAQTFR
jgi:hypothetical protein